MFSEFCQVIIVVSGAASLFLVTSRNAMSRRWAGPIGTLAEPFWFYASFTEQQWGILALSLVYGFRWAQCWKRDWFGSRKITHETA